MAFISCNSGYQCSTSLALAVSLVLVLFASTSPCAEAFSRARPWSTTADETVVPPLSVKFRNNLTQTLNVTTGTPQYTALAPGASATLPVDAQASSLQFQVNRALYIDTARGQASVLGSLVTEVGVLSIVVGNGPCATGQAGLSLVSYADGKLSTPRGEPCASDGCIGSESSRPKQQY